MDFPIFNNTNKLIFLCDEKDIGKYAIKALNLAMSCIKKNVKIKNPTQQQIMHEPTRKGYPRLSLFKYFQYIEAKEINEKWMQGILSLANSNYQEVRNKIREYIPASARHLPISQNHARALKRDLQLLLHCCWATKFTLLPLSFSPLPTLKNNKNGEWKEWAFDAYPEILRIIRKPFCEKLFENTDITEYVGRKSITNLNWYVHRYVRACAAWKVEDISPEMLLEIWESPSKNVPRTVDWYIALMEIMPERVRYTIADVYVTKNGGAFGKKGHRNPPELRIESFPPLVIKENPNIEDWIVKGTEYLRLLYDNGTKSYHSHSLAIGKVLNALVSDSSAVPLLRDINRKDHIEIIKNVLKVGVQTETYREQLVKIHDFLEFVMLIEKGFSNPISRKLDLPVSSRSKGTKKEIVEEDLFAAFLSYLYGIAEWLWYISESYDDKEAFLSKKNNKLESVEASSVGFSPLMFIDGKPHRIERIPRQLIVPLFGHKQINSQVSELAIMPHYIHIAITMAETGIRLIHLRWLDKFLYDKDVNRAYFNEYSYIPTKLHINTDKAHGPWDSDVVESVIGLLDRQLAWRNKYLRGKDGAIHYDHYENSGFDDIRPLFASPDSKSTIEDDFSVVSDGSFRKTYRNLFIAFSWMYKKLGYKPPLDIDDCATIEECMKKWRVAKIKYTPHSMRSQVVSDNITILPPSLIQKITGHANQAHLLYYAQLSNRWIDNQQAAQDKEFKEFIEPMMIDARSKNSKLNIAMKTNPLAALKDFGGISFGSGAKTGLTKVRDDVIGEKNIYEMISFNSTHMCPFNNDCPKDVVYSELEGFKRCGECSYSIKTVDHQTSIVAKIRSFSDKSSELEQIIMEAKDANSDMDAYSGEIALKKYYANEIAAWTITVNCLEEMKKSLEHKDKWLISEPDILSKKLKNMTSSNELTNLLVRIEEAQNSQEFMTPQLKAKVTIFRNKVLAQSGQFQRLMADIPAGQNLISEFKGIIKSICDITGIGVNELPEALNQKCLLPSALQEAIKLPGRVNGGNNE
tara:strand:- start:7335 stop:10424 length:3090 start_codon:yes stop_codon:yes gene_type:complete